MNRKPVTPEDLVKSGEAAQDALAQLTGPQWQEKPPNMDWTRHETVLHACAAQQAYATQLATGAGHRVTRLLSDTSFYTGAELPGLIASQSVLLSEVAKASPPGKRGWHSWGPPDTEGFLAMGCAEILLHTWDCMAGTAAGFTPDDELADRVVSRLFPWAPTVAPRWQALLFVTGRAELEGHESPGNEWMWHCQPLDEWDREVKTSDARVGR